MANSSSLKLSANELRTMTNWNDAVVLQFLSMQSGIENITNIINIVINNIDSISVNVSDLQPQITRLRGVVAQLQEQTTELDSLPAKIAGLRRDMLVALNAEIEARSALNALPVKIAGMNRDLQRGLDTERESRAALNALPAKVANNRRDLQRNLLDLQQELAGG